MPLGSMQVLAPNRLGHSMENYGVASLVANRGYGVPQAMPTNPDATAQQQTANPALVPLRRAKAREFGLKMQDVGF